MAGLCVSLIEKVHCVVRKYVVLVWKGSDLFDGRWGEIRIYPHDDLNMWRDR